MSCQNNLNEKFNKVINFFNNFRCKNANKGVQSDKMYKKINISITQLHK